MTETMTAVFASGQAYRRGYSDGQAGRDRDGYSHGEHQMAYQRGFSRGMKSTPRGVMRPQSPGTNCYVHPDEGRGKGHDGEGR